MLPIISYLGLGSNKADRLDNIRSAIRLISQSHRMRIKKISPFYETSPVGGPRGQSAFINAAIKIITTYSPFDLLVFIKNIEKTLKRAKTAHWGPRTIDIDILFYDDLVLASRALTIPHPLVHMRKFVLQPLSDIAANFMHPFLNITILSLFQKKGDHNEEEVIALDNQ